MAHQLLEWYYLIFELPLALGLLYLGLYTFSGWSFGEADADASGIDHDVDAHLDTHGEVSLDHDADLSHDVNLDADADADADADSDVHADAHTDSSESETQPSAGFSVLTALGWIGLGRMPLGLLLMLLLICWGSIGMATMQLRNNHPIESWAIVALVIAGAGSILITHFLSSIMAKLLYTGNNSRRRHELLGSFGEALYTINASFGMACGRDDRGELFQVACRTDEGQPAIEKGTAIQLVSYTAKDQMFYVVPADSSVTPRRGAVGSK